MQKLTPISEEHKQKVLHLLGVCQVLELALKVFISRKQHYVELEAGNNVPSERIYQEIKDFPLGCLIRRLRKLSVNKDLIEKLNKVKDERDYLAHQGLLHCFKFTSDFLENVKEPRREFDFIRLNNQMTECLTLISQE